LCLLKPFAVTEFHVRLRVFRFSALIMSTGSSSPLRVSLSSTEFRSLCNYIIRSYQCTTAPIPACTAYVLLETLYSHNLHQPILNCEFGWELSEIRDDCEHQLAHSLTTDIRPVLIFHNLAERCHLNYLHSVCMPIISYLSLPASPCSLCGIPRGFRVRRRSC
jgi:hypothetical protein